MSGKYDRLIDMDDFDPQPALSASAPPAYDEDTVPLTGSIAVDTPRAVPRAAAPAGPNHFWSVNYYRQYFDTDTSTFLAHCLHALVPFTRMFKGETVPAVAAGELYGAVWCTATIIVLLFLSSTGSAMLTNWVKHADTKYHYDFALLTTSMSLLYGYIIAVPALLFAAGRWYLKLPDALSLVRYISIYGYATVPWIPASILGLVGGLLGNHSLLSSLLRWLCIGIGGVLSLLNILIEISPSLKRNLALVEKPRALYAVVGAVVVAHVGFTIAVKVCFFGTLA